MIFRFSKKKTKKKNDKIILSLAWNTMFTDYWKVLVLKFLEMENGIFFEPKSWWEDDIYWLLKSSCFEFFRDEKYGLFLSQNVNGKMIYTWSFRAFHDIPGLGKYGFSCSVHAFHLKQLSNKIYSFTLLKPWILLLFPFNNKNYIFPKTHSFLQ